MGEAKRRRLVEGGFTWADEEPPVGRMFIAIAERLKEHFVKGHVMNLVHQVDSLDEDFGVVEICCSVCINELPICFMSEELADEMQRIFIAAGIRFEDVIEH